MYFPTFLTSLNIERKNMCLRDISLGKVKINVWVLNSGFQISLHRIGINSRQLLLSLFSKSNLNINLNSKYGGLNKVKIAIWKQRHKKRIKVGSYGNGI